MFAQIMKKEVVTKGANPFRSLDGTFTSKGKHKQRPGKVAFATVGLKEPVPLAAIMKGK